jgi:hypothetical protein
MVALLALDNILFTALFSLMTYPVAFEAHLLIAIERFMSVFATKNTV